MSTEYTIVEDKITDMVRLYVNAARRKTTEAILNWLLLGIGRQGQPKYSRPEGKYMNKGERPAGGFCKSTYVIYIIYYITIYYNIYYYENS